MFGDEFLICKRHLVEISLGILRRWEKRDVGPRVGKHPGLDLGASGTPGAALDAEAEGSSLAESHAKEPRTSS